MRVKCFRLKLFFALCTCFGLLAGAQTKTITGSVVTTGGEPVIGATIMIDDSQIGTTTDADGRFVITGVPNSAKNVSITYVGMKKATVAITPQMKIEMQSSVEELDEVFVVAYGTAKKSSFAGSAALVKAGDIKDVATTTFENALNGKVAGLQITNNSGQAGSAPAIRIRGIGSMNAGNEPLYVIDGVPVASGNIRQMKGAQGWFLASDYFLNRLSEDASDVRWGVMGNDEYWRDTDIDRKGACYKYLGGTGLAGDGKSTITAVNIKVLRLSEVYLIASEAALHATTPDADKAATYLNAIRCRATQLPVATAATVSDDMILDERSKELFGEGNRFFDMIRLNRSITYNDDFQNVPVSTREKTIDRTFYKIVLPISQDEINANPALASQQNPGY